MCDLRRCDACCPLSCGHLTPHSRSANVDFISTGHRGSASEDPAARWHQPGRCIHARRQADVFSRCMYAEFSVFFFLHSWGQLCRLRRHSSEASRLRRLFLCESAPACERLEMNKMEMKMRYSCSCNKPGGLDCYRRAPGVFIRVEQRFGTIDTKTRAGNLPKKLTPELSSWWFTQAAV